MARRSIWIVGLIGLVTLARLLPHFPNFTPLTAVALFGGAHFHSRWAAFGVPLLALLLSDAALEATTALGLHAGWMAGGSGFHPGMWVVYTATALVAAVGLSLRRRQSVGTVAGAVLGSSVLFFLVTNFAWWVGYDLYPHTVEGLLQCYLAALPFFHWSLLGDACYATLLFGGYALAERRFPVAQPATP